MLKTFDLLTCVKDEHDLRLVLLAGVLCFLSCLTTLHLFRRARSKGGSAITWLLMGGAAGGGGAWATHFIAMLAYTPHVPVGFNMPLTFLSLLLAVVLTTMALGVAYKGGHWRGASGGALLGFGVAAMHHLGVAAIEAPARINWAPEIVLVSIGLGVALSIMAIMLARANASGRILFAAASTQTLAIVSLHFWGMASLKITPDPTRTFAAYAFSPETLSLAIAGVATALLCIGFTTALADRRLSGQAKLFDAEILRLRQSTAWLSHHDVLTGLPNRAAFNEKLAAVVERAEGQNESFAILSINLYRLREVNELHGHSVGDQLLQRLSQRFSEIAGGACFARISGDDFSMILQSEHRQQEAEALANRFVASLARPFEIDGQAIVAGISVGIAIYPNDGVAATIRAAAEAALFVARADGRGKVRFFDRALGAALHERHMLQQDIGVALARGEFALHYQPQINPDGRVVGFEALLRWTHPKRGSVSPGIFIPIAEESGAIVALGEWVLREACREAQSWREPLRIAVNLSPVQFRQDDLPERVDAILFETGLAGARLELEITEGVLVDDVGRATSVLRRLKSLEVGIAIDDFGTGYSSLSYLQSFPFDWLKVDRSFVSRLHCDAQSDSIVRAIIDLGHGLGLSVIAEGVETQAQFDFLAQEGCDELQGYFIGRPAEIGVFSALTAGSELKRDGVAA